MNKQTLTELRSTFEGAEAIYREAEAFSRVRVSKIKIDEWGMSAQIELVPTPGLFNKRPKRWSISSAWEVFYCTPDRMGQPYISMAMYFGQPLVDTVVNFCKGLETDYTPEHTNAIFGCLKDFSARAEAQGGSEAP